MPVRLIHKVVVREGSLEIKGDVFAKFSGGGDAFEYMTRLAERPWRDATYPVWFTVESGGEVVARLEKAKP